MGRQAKPKPKVRPYLQSGHQLFTCNGVRLVALLLGSILISLWLANSSVTADSLFQSPASPVMPLPENQPPVEVPPFEQPPAPEQQPPVEQPPDPEQQPPVEQPSIEQPQPQQLLEGQPPADAAVPVPPAQELDSPPLMTEEQPAPATGRSDRDRREREQPVAADESPNFILDQVEFIDTVVVSGAYLWLCCGVMLFLLVPIFMLVLYIRGRSKLAPDEGF